MTEKVCLADIKRPQNICFPLRLYGKKANPKRRTLSRSSRPQSRSKEPEQHRGEKVYARKSLSFARKTRIKPAAERGGLWRKMADFVGLCGGKWRTLSDYVAENGGFCRVNASSIMAFLSALCDLCGKTFVAENGEVCRKYVAENGGLCRIMWRKMADFVE